MRLGTKIFLASAGSLAVLSAVTIFLVADRTTRSEEERIGRDLQRAQELVEEEMVDQVRETSLLVIPELPRIRGLIGDPRDNFIEIARDLRRSIGCEAVLCTDAQGAVLGVDASSATLTAALRPERFPLLPRAIDTAKRAEYVEP